MIPYPNIDPVAVSFGPIKIHWYGLMYVLAFAIAWLLGRKRIKLSSALLTPQEFDDLLFWLFAGVIIGGRVGYVLFYNLASFVNHPLSLFAVWQGGDVLPRRFARNILRRFHLCQYKREIPPRAD